MSIHNYAWTRTCVNLCMSICIQRSKTHLPLHTNKHAHSHPSAYTPARTYPHTITHTHTDTHTHIHTQPQRYYINITNLLLKCFNREQYFSSFKHIYKIWVYKDIVLEFLLTWCTIAFQQVPPLIFFLHSSVTFKILGFLIYQKTQNFKGDTYICELLLTSVISNYSIILLCSIAWPPPGVLLFLKYNLPLI